jgi:hypothetical protein
VELMPSFLHLRRDARPRCTATGEQPLSGNYGRSSRPKKRKKKKKNIDPKRGVESYNVGERQLVDTGKW